MSEARVDVFAQGDGKAGAVSVHADDRGYTVAFGPDQEFPTQSAARREAFRRLWPGCVQHRHFASPCPHCREDAKILEERIGRVAFAVYPGDVALRETLTDALRELVREVRRG